MGEATAAIRAFTADLYRGVAQQSGNVVVAPFSAAAALGMALAGARGSTATEMARVLHTADPAAIGAALTDLVDRQAALSPEDLDRRGNEPPVLDVANAIWAQDGARWEDDFLATLASGFGAELQTADFSTDATGAADKINSWVARLTRDKITDIVDGLDPLTRMVLVNAAYFKAQWVSPFTGRTAPALFTLADGSTVEVDTMSGSLSRLGYARGEDWQAVRLPFVSDHLAMAVVLPDEQASLDDLEAVLDGDRLGDLLSGFENRPSIQLRMPRFRFRSRTALGDQLVALGMPTAFDGDRADFSGMTTEDRLHIDAVLHEAYIAVDENGAEAAAATAVVMVTRAMVQQPLEVTVDRPFLFVIFDTANALPLFIGRVADPR